MAFLDNLKQKKTSFSRIFSFFWIFHPPSGASHKLSYTAFEHGGRNFSPALLAATAFHFVSKCDVSGVASRQILLICLITCVYFAGATLKSCYESVEDGFWFHFVLNVFSFVVSVVIVIVGVLHSNTLGKIRDFHGVSRLVKGMVKYQGGQVQSQNNQNNRNNQSNQNSQNNLKNQNTQNNQNSNNFQNNQNNSFQSLQNNQFQNQQQF